MAYVVDKPKEGLISRLNILMMYPIGQSNKMEIGVVDWGIYETVVIYLKDLEKLITLSPSMAREMAFALVEASDKIQKPFEEEYGYRVRE